MRNKILAFLMAITVSGIVQAQTPDKKPLRIVDSLSVQEKTSRNPIILRSELDSMIKQWVDAHPVTPVQQPVEQKNSDLQNNLYWGLGAIALLFLILIWSYNRQQRKINQIIAGLPVEKKETSVKHPTVELNGKTSKGRVGVQALEKKITELDAELHKLTKENEGMDRLIKEYNGIQHEFDTLRHGLSRAYKIKNYPGYDKTKAETSLLQGVLDTEASVANYAYEKFLKPLHALIDTNKNNPAKISTAHKEKMMDLLISLSLLYIEYLYLRVTDLSIGGKMVERIQGFSNGNGLDHSLLKKMDTEFGSRALVLRMVLDNNQLRELSYPVFDETNLNSQ